MEPRKVKQDEDKVLIREREFLRHGSVKPDCPQHFNPYLSAHAACNVEVHRVWELPTHKFIA